MDREVKAVVMTLGRTNVVEQRVVIAAALAPSCNFGQILLRLFRLVLVDIIISLAC